MPSLRQALAGRFDAPEGGAPARARYSLLIRELSPDLVLPDEEAETVAERAAHLHSSLKPWDAFEEWLLGQVATITVRLDGADHHERVLGDLACRRAALRWDEDRAADAQELGAGLARAPEKVLARLLRTKPGARWLLGRWEGLGRVLEARGSWDGPQRRLALDLLGVPPELRAGPTPLDPAPGEDARSVGLAVVAGQVARLSRLIESALEELDGLERESAEVGLGPELDRPRAQLRRHRAALAGRLAWCLGQFKKVRPTGASVAPARLARPEPPTPSPAPSPTAVRAPTPPPPSAVPPGWPPSPAPSGPPAPRPGPMDPIASPSGVPPERTRRPTGLLVSATAAFPLNRRGRRAQEARARRHS